MVPEKTPYDVVIVGAGPGGIASAVKAHEEGLKYLVLEKGPDVLADMREKYPPEKRLYPAKPRGADDGFEVSFLKPPEEKVNFESYLGQVKEGLKDLDADRFNFWEHFKSFEKREGLFDVETNEDRYRTRTLVLAIGAGMPRELKIYGEAAPVTHTLKNPEDYVGEHVLVIGGGNSGAGVVRNLSRVKREQDDPTHIYWAHRREKFKVDREVARDLGEEILLGGEIKILQETTPTVGMRDKDGTLMLNIKVSDYLTEEGVRMYGGMSFPMRNVIACIGYKNPVRMLESFGVDTTDKNSYPKGAEKREPRLVLNENLETSLEGVYVVGGAVGPTFMKSRGDELEKVSHPNLIYTAVNDGTRAVEDIAEKLGGRGGPSPPPPESGPES